MFDVHVGNEGKYAFPIIEMNEHMDPVGQVIEYSMHTPKLTIMIKE